METESYDDSSVCDGDLTKPLPSYKYWYAFRITPYNDDVTMEDVLSLDCIKTGVVSEEVEQNRHFHLVMGTDDDFSTKYLRTSFYKKLYEAIKTDKGGNKFIAFNGEVKDMDKAFPYALKDGNYIYTEDLEDHIQYWAQISYEKPKGFKKDKKDLDTLFMQTLTMTPQCYWEQLGLLRSSYDLPVSVNQLDQYTLSIWLKRSPEKIHKIIEKSNIFNDI